MLLFDRTRTSTIRKLIFIPERNKHTFDFHRA